MKYCADLRWVTT